MKAEKRHQSPTRV